MRRVALGAALVALVAGAVALGTRPDRIEPISQGPSSESERPVDVTSAWTELDEAIRSAERTGELEPDAAEDLAEKARALLDAYRGRAALGDALSGFESVFTDAIAQEAMTSAAKNRIDGAMFELVRALQREGALGQTELSG